MKRMFLIIVTALIIIICVIAFKSFTGQKKDGFDGILIENSIDIKYDNDILMGEKVRKSCLKREFHCLVKENGCILLKENVRNGEIV